MNPDLDRLLDHAATLDSIASEATTPAADARLAHLFRASLSQGRLHPLYVPMLRYRGTRAVAG